MENINTIGQTPEDLKTLSMQRLKQAEELLVVAQENKKVAEENGDTDAVALAETRIEHAEAAVEKARQNIEG
jgi:hypothetical protein